MLMLMCCVAPIALAQQPQDAIVAPAPSDSELQNRTANANNSPTPQLAPVPVLQPMLSPQDQMRLNQPQTPNTQNIAPPVTPSDGNPANNQPVAPQLVPVNAQQQIQQPQIPQQQLPPQAALPAPMPLQEPGANDPVMDQIAAEAAAQAPAQQAPAQQAPVQPSPAVGFSQAGDRALPLNQGLMPLDQTNTGINMDIDPNLVGGTELDAYGNPVSAVPYEVQLERRTREIQIQARERAFEQAKKSVLPMETNEIRDVLGRLKDTQEAIQTPVRPAPKPANVIETISTDPSAVPKTIRLAAGNVTTINIVDITGEPWPIVDLGFGGTFDVKPPEAGGHVIRITPLRDFARGNLVVRLLKMTTPITFSLEAGGSEVNYRFDARIPDYGPNARMPILDNGIHAVAGDKTTTAFLEGVPPKGSERLDVAGIDGRTSAYKYGGALYVRTPLSLISPAWQGSATSADGMNVFVLTDAPVLLLSDKGTLVRARISAAKKDVTGF